MAATTIEDEYMVLDVRDRIQGDAVEVSDPKTVATAAQQAGSTVTPAMPDKRVRIAAAESWLSANDCTDSIIAVWNACCCITAIIGAFDTRECALKKVTARRATQIVDCSTAKTAIVLEDPHAPTSMVYRRVTVKPI